MLWSVQGQPLKKCMSQTQQGEGKTRAELRELERWNATDVPGAWPSPAAFLTVQCSKGWKLMLRTLGSGLELQRGWAPLQELRQGSATSLQPDCFSFSFNSMGAFCLFLFLSVCLFCSGFFKLEMLQEEKEEDRNRLEHHCHSNWYFTLPLFLFEIYVVTMNF